MYEAQCILKQRQRKKGRREFIVRWADPTATDLWTKEDEVSDVLLAHWLISHNQKGSKPKRLNLALIRVQGPWPYKQSWNGRLCKKNRESRPIQ